MRRTSICGATETILCHKRVAANILPKLLEKLIENNCIVKGNTLKKLNGKVLNVTEEDWSKEYLDAIVSIKIVDSLEEAIKHINTYSSGHTDAIITEKMQSAAKKFLETVNSAIVMHNTSTQFADGAEFGLGAEIGISTGKLHARGPVSTEELTTYKYVVEGKGQLRN